MLISIHLENIIKQTSIQMKVKPFLPPQQEYEYPYGSRNENEKHHSEEGKLKKEGSPILTSTICTRRYLVIIYEPWIQPITTALNVKASR